MGGEPVAAVGAYVLSWPATKLKVALSLVPTAEKAAIAAIEIKDAMRPYSIAVAPDSSFTKREKKLVMTVLRCSFSLRFRGRQRALSPEQSGISAQSVT